MYWTNVYARIKLTYILCLLAFIFYMLKDTRALCGTSFICMHARIQLMNFYYKRCFALLCWRCRTDVAIYIYRHRRHIFFRLRWFIPICHSNEHILYMRTENIIENVSQYFFFFINCANKNKPIGKFSQWHLDIFLLCGSCKTHMSRRKNMNTMRWYWKYVFFFFTIK